MLTFPSMALYPPDAFAFSVQPYKAVVPVVKGNAAAGFQFHLIRPALRPHHAGFRFVNTAFGFRRKLRIYG